MASNDKVEIGISGDTTKFEKSLRDIDAAMASLKAKATILKKALELDPSNIDKMQQLQKNLQQQLEISKNKASQLKNELGGIGKSTPDNQNKWISLQTSLTNTGIQADRLESNIKGIDSAIRNGSWQAQAEIDMNDSAVNGKIDGFKSKFKGIRETAVNTFQEIGSKAVSALGNGLKGWVSGAMDTQKAMNSLKTTMNFAGNGSEFDSLSKRMTTLSKGTNANTGDTLKLASTFIGLGSSAKEAGDRTDALVKANQAFGGSGEDLEGIAQAYSQMSDAGKVTSDNIEQLTGNNVAFGSAIKSTIMEMNPALKQYGSFAGASEAGAISVDMLDKAMTSLGKSGGGSAATIGEAWDNFSETMSTALLPAIDALTPAISGIISSISASSEQFGKMLEQMIKWILELYKSLQENGALDSFIEVWSNLKGIFDAVVGIIGDVISSFLGINSETDKSSSSIESISKDISIFANWLSNITKNLSDFLTNLKENKGQMDLVKVSISALAGAFAGFKIATTIMKGIETFKSLKTAIQNGTMALKIMNAVSKANIWVAVASAVAALVVALIYFFTQTKLGKEIWENFVNFLKTTWEGILTFFQGLGTWFSELWTGMVEVAKEIWNTIVEFFTNIVIGIQEKWTAFTTFWTELWNTIIEIINGVWQIILEAVGIFIQNVTTFFQSLIEVVQSIINFWLEIFNLGLQTILAVVAFVINGVSLIWQGLIAIVNNVWLAILTFFTPIITSIQNVVQLVTSAIGLFFQNAWQFIASIWGAASIWFSNIFNAVSAVVSGVFSAIGGFASNAWTTITNVFSVIGSWFGEIFEGAKSVVSGVFDSFGNIASGAWEAIKNTFGGVYEFFVNAFSGVKDFIDNIFGGISSTINGVSKAINGISGTVSKMFKGSLVSNLPDLNLNSASQGMTQNSVSTDNRTYNTFNVSAGGGDVTNLARAIRREFNTGRA